MSRQVQSGQRWLGTPANLWSHCVSYCYSLSPTRRRTDRTGSAAIPALWHIRLGVPKCEFIYICLITARADIMSKPYLFLYNAVQVRFSEFELHNGF